MCSTPKSKSVPALLLLTAAAILPAGCMRADRNTAAIPLNPLPLKEDPAMARYDVPPIVAWYPNVGVVAGPTGQTFVPANTFPNGKPVPPALHLVTDDGIFLANMALMPIRLTMQPPWTTKVYRGVTVEPTYAASPPLEPTTPATR